MESVTDCVFLKLCCVTIVRQMSLFKQRAAFQNIMIKFDHEGKIVWYGLQSFLQEGEIGGGKPTKSISKFKTSWILKESQIKGKAQQIYY